jgi:HNH endonuclease/NUMOD4 motif
MTEMWRPVVDWEDLYEVSNMGHLRSLPRVVSYRDGRVRSFSAGVRSVRMNRATKYVQVCLHRDNIATQSYVHRLVALAFVPNPANKKCVNHLDGNRSNNVHTNLEWCSHAENIRHAHSVGLAKALSGEDAHNARLTWKDAEQLRHDVWNVVRQWSEERGVHTQVAWDVIAKRGWVK